MINLDIRPVAQAAREAFMHGRLSAQAPVPAASYRTEQGGRIYRCAIGASLTDSDWDALTAANPSPRSDLNQVRLGLLDGWRSDNPDAVVTLQEAHDAWAMGELRVLDANGPEATAAARTVADDHRAAFLRHLDNALGRTADTVA